MNNRATFDAQLVLQRILIVGVLIMVGFFVYRAVSDQLKTSTIVSIGSAVLRADLAETEAARQKGLSGRNELASDAAMLLVFPDDGHWGIWMKGMKFPIDVIWLDGDKNVVHVEHNLQPDAEPYDVYKPPKVARYVLEMNAGRAREFGVKVGSVAKFNNSKGAL